MRRAVRDDGTKGFDDASPAAFWLAAPHALRDCLVVRHVRRRYASVSENLARDRVGLAARQVLRHRPRGPATDALDRGGLRLSGSAAGDGRRRRLPESRLMLRGLDDSISQG
jgi:hypothetical protein